MTCIVGLVHDGKVFLGGDAAGTAGYEQVTRTDLKVFEKGPFIMGFTSSYRMGQLLRYKLNAPKRHVDQDIMEFMVSDFVEAVRTCLKTGGFARKDSEEESGGFFLVGYEGRLFGIESDYQVGENTCGYDAVGSGAQYAKGSLFTTRKIDMTPELRITLALEAAEDHNAGVRGPFTIISN